MVFRGGPPDPCLPPAMKSEVMSSRIIFGSLAVLAYGTPDRMINVVQNLSTELYLNIIRHTLHSNISLSYAKS